MRTKNSQMLLALLALLTMVFSIGFFIGRQSIPYEVAAQTEHAVKQTDELPAQEETDKPDAAAGIFLHERITSVQFLSMALVFAGLYFNASNRSFVPVHRKIQN